MRKKIIRGIIVLLIPTFVLGSCILTSAAIFRYRKNLDAPRILARIPAGELTLPLIGGAQPHRESIDPIELASRIEKLVAASNLPSIEGLKRQRADRIPEEPARQRKEGLE